MKALRAEGALEVDVDPMGDSEGMMLPGCRYVTVVSFLLCMFDGCTITTLECKMCWRGKKDEVAQPRLMF